MATRYLLPCSCGESIAVSPSQAGDRVTCGGCGASVEAPALRRLRELPPAPVETATASSWGLRQGVVSAGLVVAALVAALGGWFALQEPDPPAPFDAEARQLVVEKRLDSLPPAELWNLWTQFYLPQGQQGFNKVESPRDAETLARIEWCRASRDRLLIASAVVLGATLLAYATLPRAGAAP